MPDRFQIVDKSVSGHCCFEFTVVDTKHQDPEWTLPTPKTICETFYRDCAEMVCNALNASSKAE